MSTIWVDTARAAALLGFTKRHFTRKFVKTGELEVHIFDVNGREYHRFLVEDVLRLEAKKIVDMRYVYRG